MDNIKVDSKVDPVRMNSKKIKTGKNFTIMLESEHLSMLKEIAKSYRIPNNMSHSMRLMIEDTYASIMRGKEHEEV